MSMKEAQQELAFNMERWQKVEKETVDYVGKIIEQSDNPIVQHVLRIIQHDSEMHHKTQELILGTLNGTVSLSPEEIGTVWEMIEKHIKMEEAAVEMAEAAKRIIKERTMPVQAYLVEYLLTDEKKHDQLLEGLENIKKKMYPYG